MRRCSRYRAHPVPSSGRTVTEGSARRAAERDRVARAPHHRPHVLAWNALRKFGPNLRFGPAAASAGRAFRLRRRVRRFEPRRGAGGGISVGTGPIATAVARIRPAFASPASCGCPTCPASGEGSGPPGWAAATMLSIRRRTDCPDSGHAPSIAPTPIPQRPVLSLPLSHPGLADASDTVAHELGCVIT